VKPMQAKEDLLELCAGILAELETQRAERPALLLLACRRLILEDKGWFGFLVSSSWFGCRIRLRLAIMGFTI